ncbi:hypothetical protein J5N97_001074, partial [Dioscorea zingiberensis]
MLEDQVAFLLQKYLGNYVRGLSKEALKISVWNGDVELKNMQLRPEALNALKLPVRVKAGFLGSVKLKVPWSRLGQEPVLVALDHILILAEPATQVEGSSEDAIQEAKKLRIRELETRLLESQQHLKSETDVGHTNLWKQSTESTINRGKQKTKRSWWSTAEMGWIYQGIENEARGFTEEDWEQLNRIIGYKEGSDEQLLTAYDRGDLLHVLFEIHMKHNASKLVTDNQVYLADLSCEGLYCSIKSYSEAKVFNLKLGSYRLSSPYGLLAESATLSDSLVGVFSYKPLDAQVDWSLAAKASPCYVTYIKDSVDQIVAFFKSGTAVSQSIALETAAAVQ